jgi:hypothetical protein
MIRPRSSLLLAAILGGAACAASPLSYTYLSQRGDVTVVGDSRGVERALSFKQGDASLLWFREGGQEYIVRDVETLAQLEAAWTTPRRELELEVQKLESEREDIERQLKSSSERSKERDRSREKLSAQKDALEHQQQLKRELGPRNNDVEVRALFRRAIAAGKATPVR